MIEDLQVALDSERERHKETRRRLRELERVQLVSEILAGPMRLEASRLRRDDGTVSPITFVSTFDNDLRAHMGENEAKLFAMFVYDTLGDGGRRTHAEALEEAYQRGYAAARPLDPDVIYLEPEATEN